MPGHVYDGATWRAIQQMYVYDGSSWKVLESGLVYDGSSWQTFFTKNPCLGETTLTSVTATDQALNNCAGTGWICRGSTNVGSLQAGLEYYVERAIDSGGSSFSFWGRKAGPTWDSNDPTIGADGPGISTQVWCTFKVWIVPIGAGTGEACSGPVTSNTATRTADACFG